jgi:hypothetical protein
MATPEHLQLLMLLLLLLVLPLLVSRWWILCGQGLTCAEFQKLPNKLHSAAGAGVFDLAQSKNWKRCPKCGHMVERTEGCNHMQCRCRTQFCYGCGGRFQKGTGRCLCH